jgi:hypothetical protein
MAQNIYDRHGNVIGIDQGGGLCPTYSSVSESNSKVTVPNTMANPKGTVQLADGECGLYPSFPTGLGQVLKAVPIDNCNPSSRGNVEVDWDYLAIKDIYGLTEALDGAGVKTVSVNGGVKILPDISGNINIPVASTASTPVTLDSIRNALGITNATNGLLNVTNGLISFIPVPSYEAKRLKLFPYTTTNNQPSGPHVEYTAEYKLANPQAQIRGLEVSFYEGTTLSATDWLDYGEFVDMTSIVPNSDGKLQVSGVSGVSPYSLGSLAPLYTGQQGAPLGAWPLLGTTVPVGTLGNVTINGIAYPGNFNAVGFVPPANVNLPLNTPLGTQSFTISTTSLTTNLSITGPIIISGANVNASNPFPYSFGNAGAGNLDFQDISGTSSPSFAPGDRYFSVVLFGSSVPRSTPLGAFPAAPGSVGFASAVNQFFTLTFGNGDIVSGSLYYRTSDRQPGDPDNIAQAILKANITSLGTIQYINTSPFAPNRPTATLRLYTTTLNTNANSVYEVRLFRTWGPIIN